MPIRRNPRRLLLGPIVGHTDQNSSRIWIRVRDNPINYELRVSGTGLFKFSSTEAPFGLQEFGTAIALAEGLRPDWRYRYSILRHGRVVPGASGTFRTMPLPGTMTHILFCAISCSVIEKQGAWPEFERFVMGAKPHFILMMGDQVYIDEDGVDVFKEHFLKVFRNRFEASSPARRKALVDKYQRNWSRPQARRVMANIPCYMMWDDHEIRDGWGSLASDSPTLRSLYPRGEEIYRKSTIYFEDARDIYWHFQASHGPLSNYDLPAPGRERYAMPYYFRCGRVMVIMIDSRGDRDFFRKELPVLGAAQWQFLESIIKNLSEDIDAVVVMTPTPIASIDPQGQSMKLLGGRTDDVEAFKRGDHEALFNLGKEGSADKIVDSVLGPIGKNIFDPLLTAVNPRLSRLFGFPLNLGNFKVSNIDEARDQWSQAASQPEQAQLIRLAGYARKVNRNGPPREIIFVSGDIHAGCIFDIHVSNPKYTAASLTSSGISVAVDDVLEGSVGVLVDQEFKVAKGIHSTLREFVRGVNYGIVQVLVDPAGAKIIPALAHKGNSFTLGLDIADLL